MKKIALLLLILTLPAAPLCLAKTAPAADTARNTDKSLKFDYDVRMGAFLDNGEYNSSYKYPQTMSGAYVTPAVGIRFNSKHRIMTGISFLQNFGTKAFSEMPDFLAYYNYQGRIFNGFGGLLPRAEMKGHYSRALFSDSVDYFKHSLAGALLQWEGERGQAEVFFDWNLQNTKTGQESFMAGSAGRLKFGKLFYAGYAGYMYHYRIGTNNVGEGSPNFLVDNVMYHLYGGADFAPLTPLDILSLEVGIVGSESRGRQSVENAGGWISRAGFQARFNIEWHGWGIEDTFFAGNGLLPLFDIYGTRVYWGDSFYNAPIYNRTDVYWSYKVGNRVDFRAALVFHATGQGLDFCQQATLRVHLHK